MKQKTSVIVWLSLAVFGLLLLFTESKGQDNAATNPPSQSVKFESGASRTIKVWALRLHPGQDLRQQIEAFVKAKGIRAGYIITAVGSLRHVAIRLADQANATEFDEKFEIVSLVGTLGQGGVHLHLAISDGAGKTIGGHLVPGCLIYTTAEIVIGASPDLVFTREPDKQTGYQELRIRPATTRRRHPSL